MMTLPIPARCGTCMFRKVNYCLRFPPASGDNVSRRPWVDLDDQCGEWTPSDAAVNHFRRVSPGLVLTTTESVRRQGWDWPYSWPDSSALG